MRRVLIGSTLALMLAASAQAAEPLAGQLNVTVGGGLNMPAADEAADGYVVGAGVGFHVMPQLVLGAEVSYLGYGRDRVDSGGLGVSGVRGPGQHLVDYVATGKYHLGRGEFTPYVKGLLGRYDYTADVPLGNQTVEFTHDDVVYGGGIGMLVRGRSESSLYMEALARQFKIEDDTTRLYTFTVGFDFSFLP